MLCEPDSKPTPPAKSASPLAGPCSAQSHADTARHSGSDSRWLSPKRASGVTDLTPEHNCTSGVFTPNFSGLKEAFISVLQTSHNIYGCPPGKTARTTQLCQWAAVTTRTAVPKPVAEETKRLHCGIQPSKKQTKSLFRPAGQVDKAVQPPNEWLDGE